MRLYLKGTVSGLGDFLLQAFSGKFANGVNDIVGKFATAVVDTGVIDIN